MKIPKSIFRYAPLLLLLSAILIVVGDQSQFGPSTPVRGKMEKTPAATDPSSHETHDQTHNHDHADPDKAKGMAIFHYNEGNKSLQERNLKKAVKNYHMALRHNPNFEEAYVNLSTAFLNAKNYDQAFETLQSLEKINPSNPFLAYNLASYHSLTRNTESARLALEKAVDLGYKNFQEIETDPDLANLREEPGFTEWFEKIYPRLKN